MKRIRFRIGRLEHNCSLENATSPLGASVFPDALTVQLYSSKRVVLKVKSNTLVKEPTTEFST